MLTRSLSSVRRILLLTAIVLALTSASRAEPWPKGYVLAEVTASPNGRYGLVVPDTETDLEKETTDNYFAELKTHQIIGKLKQGVFRQGMNHGYVTATWAEDSSFVLLEMGQRFGFISLEVIEFNEANMHEINLGSDIQKDLTKAVRRRAKDETDIGAVNAFTRLHEREVLVRAISTTNPKEVEGQPTTYALYVGVFDLDDVEWSEVEAKVINEEDYQALASALSPGQAPEFSKPSEEAAYLDEQLNLAYTAAKAVLSTGKFADLKAEQKDWLKERDAIKSLPARNKAVAERLQELREWLW